MKKLYLIIALVFIFRPVLPVVEYMVNYEYISTVLCENIDKPEMHCNGKCHLAKEFDKSISHKAPIQLEKVSILFDFIVVHEYESYFKRYSLSNLNEKVTLFYSNLYTFLFTSVVFQPPIL